jgi:hypothetical protein
MHDNKQIAAIAPEEHEIGANSYGHTSLSRIRQVGDKWIFPAYYIEDYYVDLFDEHCIEYEEVKVDGIAHYSVNARTVSLDWLQQARIEAYSALVWYESLEVVTYPSMLVKLVLKRDMAQTTPGWWKQAVRHAMIKAQHVIGFPCFVKLDTVSAKDTGHSCVFESVEELIRVFDNSDRVCGTLEHSALRLTHPFRALFVRKVDKWFASPTPENHVVLLLRCFVREGRLTAISSDCEDVSSKEEEWIRVHIATWCDAHVLSLLPYRDATLEVRLVVRRDIASSSSSSHSALIAVDTCIVEVNNFGADSIAGGGQFNWREDYMILNGAGELCCSSTTTMRDCPYPHVVFRGPPRLE